MKEISYSIDEQIRTVEVELAKRRVYVISNRNHMPLERRKHYIESMKAVLRTLESVRVQNQYKDAQ